MKRWLQYFCCVMILCLSGSAYAGAPISKCTSYKDFGATHHQFAITLIPDNRTLREHTLEMYYPETDKKTMRMEALGLDYSKGELFFLEVPNKNDGVYVSFNENGLLDALVIEVNKNRHQSVLFMWNEMIICWGALGVLPTGTFDARKEFMDVINGRKPYIDVHCKQFGTSNSFYVRFKDIHDLNYYRIAIYRV